MPFYILNAIRISCVHKCVSGIYPFNTHFSKNYSTVSKLLANKINKERSIRHVYSFRSPLDDITNLSKDVVLYTFEKAKFFKYLGVFGVVQLFFWAYWGTTLYETLRDVKITSEEQTEQYLSKHPLWRRINLGEKKYRLFALISCLSIALKHDKQVPVEVLPLQSVDKNYKNAFHPQDSDVSHVSYNYIVELLPYPELICHGDRVKCIGTLVITWTLPSRIVRNLVLHKGGMGATLTTYGPFGHARDINVHIRELSCQSSREEAKAYISLKIKGRWMYYLIDCRGKFHNPRLFDYTVGASVAKVW